MTSATKAAAVHPDRFRELLGKFASGVTVLTTCDGSGRPHGMTVSAFSSLSLNPPLVLACVDRMASMIGVLDATETFAVNVLSESQDALSRRFSLEEMELRFDGVPFTLGPGGAPWINGCVMTVECRRMNRLDGGDHVIYVGEVIAGIDAPDLRPLVYYGGAYHRLGT